MRGRKDITSPKVLKYLEEHPNSTSKEIQYSLGLAKTPVRETIQRLLRANAIIITSKKQPRTFIVTANPEAKELSQTVKDAANGTGSFTQCSKSYEPIILDWLKEHPASTFRQIQEALNMHRTTLSNNLYKMGVKKMIVNVSDSHIAKYSVNDVPKEEIEMTSFKDISISEPTNRTPNVMENDKQTPRELMRQLKALGYTGVLKYSKEKTLDFQKLTVEQFQKYKEAGFEGKFTIKKNYDINLSKLDI